MKVTLTNRLYFEALPIELGGALVDRFTIDNPAYIENTKMGRWNGGTSRHLEYYEETDAGLFVPRGATSQVMSLCRREGIRLEVIDKRRSLPEIEFTFHGKLRPYQQDAVKDVLSKDFGTLSAPTGSGKTITALWAIADRRQPALIIVHTKELLHQWKDQIQVFLHIPSEEIGQIGDGKRTIGEKITVALVQTLYKCVDDVSPHVGHLIVDECQRVPSRIFTEAVTAFDSKFMLGLSATAWRRDGLSRLIFW
jgi:superfamily II DNA or RNA helicase